jgi:hypothetical protein
VAKNGKISWVILGVGVATITLALILHFRSRKKVGISPFKKRLVDLSEQHYNLWNPNGVKIKEGDSRTMSLLESYWIDGAGWKNMGRSQMISEAWSAAFISKMMKDAGAGESFPYSASHSVYIRDAVKNRKQNIDSPFKAYKPDEVPIEVGDLVCYSRESGVSYDSTGAYKSHCDIVTKIEENSARTIGGNISDSVSVTNIKLNENGFLSTGNSKNYFVVIKNGM